MSEAKQPVSINGIEFDALIGSTEMLESDVPSYPVESGFSVSDGIIIKPRTLEMTLFLTNTPVTHLDRHGASLTRVQDTVRALKELYFKRELVTVTTRRGVNRNMAIASIELSNNLENGTSREIPISFREVRVAESGTATIPDSYGRGGQTGANAGTANTTISKTPAPAASAAAGEGGSKGSAAYYLGSASGLLGGNDNSARGGIGGIVGGVFS